MSINVLLDTLVYDITNTILLSVFANQFNILIFKYNGRQIIA